MKKWNLLNEYLPGKNILNILLENRGIVDASAIDLFLNPIEIQHILTHLSDEFIKTLNTAKNLINQSIKSNIPIVIHGDYDADGICATAILYKVIKNHLHYDNVHYFIPNRFEHGYGLSTSSIDEVLSKFPNNKQVLFITVDSGITATAEVDYLKSLNHLIIITDHHQPPENLPNADVCVWTDEVVGSGISWILSKILGSEDNQSISLAGLATVTDLQPLLGLNRSIVKEALKVFNSNPPLGIKKLMEVSGKKQTEVTTYDLGWVIGPRLNATGRLINAEESLKLLLTDNDTEAFDIAVKLNEVNSQRQDKTTEMYEIASISENGVMPKIIVSSNEDYHEGIIGLVAARLTQRYYRPSIVISLTEKYGKGSVRSVPGIDIIAFLRKFEELFSSLGGHPMAAGFTISRENITILQEKINQISELEIDESLLVPVVDIDLKIPLDLVSLSFLEEINKLKPFGIGNNEPLFLSEKVGISSLNIVGKESNHLSMRLFGGSNFYKAIFFNGSDYAKGLNVGDKVDIVFSIKESEFNNSKYVDLIIKDLRKSA